MDVYSSTEVKANDEKYHPLILQNTVHNQLLEIVHKIDSQKKSTFLDILHNSYRCIISCHKCKSLLEQNSFALSCGHRFCGSCGVNLDKCSSCNITGNPRIQIKDFSKILNIIKELQSDFNTERVIFEMIRYLLFPNKTVENEEDEKIHHSTPPPIGKPTETTKKSRKLTSNGRKLKTPTCDGEKLRKKLQFDRKESIDHIVGAKGLENDSENLFMETVQSRKWNGKKMQSYLDQQPTIPEMNGVSSAAKRKRETNNDVQSDRSVEKIKRVRKRNDSDSSMEGMKNVSRSSKRITKLKSESHSPDLKNQGMFFGFGRPEIVESFDKLETMLNCFDNKSYRVSGSRDVSRRINVKISSATGEAQQQNVTVQETKINSMLDVVKSTVGEMNSDVKIENALAPKGAVDTEELDLDVWKRNDKNEKKKSLFKSVKERNKKDVSIGGLLERKKLTPKGSIRSKRNLTGSLCDKESEKSIVCDIEQTEIKVSAVLNEPSSVLKSSTSVEKSQPKPESDELKVMSLKLVNIEQQSLPVIKSPNEISSGKTNSDIEKLNDSQSPKIDLQNVEKTPTTDSEQKEKSPNSSKQGFPLFLDTNDNIFSQKGNICSSTPYGVVKKSIKTYSRPKINLFNRKILEISPIIEKPEFQCNNVSTSSSYGPPIQEEMLIDSPADEFPEIPTKITVQAEIHKNPTPDDVQKRDENVQMNSAPVEPSHDLESSQNDTLKTSSPMAKVRIDVSNKNQPSKLTPTKVNLPIRVIKPITPDGSNKLVSTVHRTPEKPIFRIPSSDVSNDRKSVHSEITIPMEIEADVDKVIKSVHEIVKENLPHSTNELSANEVAQIEDERVSKINKVRKLQENINNKNQKSFSILKKNFNVSSKLAVEKVRSHSSPSPSKQNENCILNQANYSRATSPHYDESIPTQVRGTPRKSVACQTTSELHVALLKQEFPDLFEKFNLNDLSMGARNMQNQIAETPNVSMNNTKCTLVSSVTTSEKKIAEKHFANESILCGSPFSFGSANKTAVSGYALLSPEKEAGSVNKRVSCKLNFEKEIDRLENCANLDDDEFMVEPEKKNESDQSNEIDFNDDADIRAETGNQDREVVSISMLENRDVHKVLTDRIINKEDTDKTFFDIHSDDVCDAEDKRSDESIQVIPETENIIDDVIEDENKIVTDDEDDIDFVAGTPTTQPKRLLSNNLEKIITPDLLNKDVSLNEFSICGNTTPTVSFVQPLPDMSQFSVVKKPSAVDVTPNVQSNSKEECDKVSMELFSSVATNSATFDEIHVTTSGLKDTDAKIITKFCDKFGAKYLDKLTDKTTHLVVKTDPKNRTARTFKYLQAIVQRIRIVSMKWINECLARDKICSEEKYIPLDSSGENGPLRTYHVIKGVTPSPLSWLQDFCIHFTLPVPQECTLNQLQGIMRVAGAKVIDSLDEFKIYSSLHHIIIVSEEDDNDDEADKKIAGWLQRYQAVSVEFNWILEVIGRNRLVPFADYQLAEIPKEYLLRLNFPLLMLNSDEACLNSD